MSDDGFPLHNSTERAKQTVSKGSKPISLKEAARDGAIGADILNRAAGIPVAIYHAPGQAVRAAGNLLYNNLGLVEAAGNRLLGLGTVAGAGLAGAALTNAFNQSLMAPIWLRAAELA